MPDDVLFATNIDEEFDDVPLYYDRSSDPGLICLLEDHPEHFCFLGENIVVFACIYSYLQPVLGTGVRLFKEFGIESIGAIGRNNCDWNTDYSAYPHTRDCRIDYLFKTGLCDIDGAFCSKFRCDSGGICEALLLLTNGSGRLLQAGIGGAQHLLPTAHGVFQHVIELQHYGLEIDFPAIGVNE